MLAKDSRTSDRALILITMPGQAKGATTLIKDRIDQIREPNSREQELVKDSRVDRTLLQVEAPDLGLRTAH